jgi:hypothetical protein
MSTNYDVSDEYDVAQGIYDALSLKLDTTVAKNGLEWLGWEFSKPSLGEIEIVADGKKYRIAVEPVED